MTAQRVKRREGQLNAAADGAASTQVLRALIADGVPSPMALAKVLQSLNRYSSARERTAACCARRATAYFAALKPHRPRRGSRAGSHRYALELQALAVGKVAWTILLSLKLCLAD